MLRRTFLSRAAPAAAAAAAAGDEAAKLPAGNPIAKSWFRSGLQIRRVASYRSRWGTGAEGVSSGVNLADQVKLHCVDNTNCKHVRLITKSAGERIAHSRVFAGVSHRVTVQRFRGGGANKQKVKPGTVYWVCLLSRRQTNTRHSGLRTNFDRNTCIIMNDQRVPVGSRIMYCAGRHVNHKYHLKAAVLANFFI
jgi:ribosomal protein L14